MIARIHGRLGTAGFVISIVALVAALSGGAYAASGGLTGKQKKEVRKIAKQYAGKRGKPGKKGKDGAAGAQGQQGAKGDTGSAGANGTNGANGSPGAPGQSVTSKALPIGNPKCPNGGTEFTSASGATVACNGEEGAEGPPGEDGAEGSPWAAGGVLPAGEAETGTWSVGGIPTVLDTSEESLESSGVINAPISFTIPLAAAGEEEGGVVQNEVPVNYLAEGEGPTTACPGTAADPDAAPGNLCVYTASGFGTSFAVEANPENNLTSSGTGKAGVILRFFLSEPGAFAYGTWVVRAPEEEP